MAIKKFLRKTANFISGNWFDRNRENIEGLRSTLRDKFGDLDGNNIKLLAKLTCEYLAGVQFYGQELQDVYAYLWFKGKKDGFFIDIGAFDGINISNTYSLEKIGWKGICVEPVPGSFERLRKNRECECINAAISGTDISKSSKFIEVQAVGLSGFYQNMSQFCQKRAEREGIIGEINVKTITFDELMNKCDKGYIDFMSVDVEGFELEILKTINFEKYKFGLITVENNQREKPKEEQLKPFMRQRGYKVLLDLGVDLLFIPIDSEVGFWWKEP